MRGTYDFYNKPWYDSIEYVDKNGRLQYGQLGCLAQLECVPKKRQRQGEEVDQSIQKQLRQRCSLALVKKYRRLRTAAAAPGEQATFKQHLVAAGCVHLQWAGTKLQNELCVVDSQYELIQLDDIVRRVYVVPDYTSLDKAGTPMHYFTNPFKYDRQVKDSRTIADKEGVLYDEGTLLQDNT